MVLVIGVILVIVLMLVYGNEMVCYYDLLWLGVVGLVCFGIVVLFVGLMWFVFVIIVI